MINFVNKGSDYNCLKSLSKQGLVQKEIQVHGKHGDFVRRQWCSAVKQTAQDYQRPVKDEYQSHGRKSKTMYFPISDCGNSRTRAFTYSDIMTYYSKHKSEIKVSIDKYIKSNYFISDGKNHTQDLYRTPKGYTRERQKLHNSIIQGIVDSANSPKNGEKPVAVLMGGGSASGKGTFRSIVVIPRLQADGVAVGISDCDDIKKQLPEYEHFLKQNPETAALRVHEESMDVAMKAVDSLIDNKKNLLFDSTMRDIRKCSAIIDKLRQAGYEIQIVGADVPLDTAMERAKSRAKQDGRDVPEWAITGSHGGFSLTYPKLLDKVDKYSLYDNSGDHAVLIQDESGVYDQAAYNKFLDKGQQHIVNKNISRIAKTYRVTQESIRDLYDNGATLEEIEEYLELGLNE